MDTNPTTAVAPPLAGALVPAQTPAQRLLAALLAGRSPRTLRANVRDLTTNMMIRSAGPSIEVGTQGARAGGTAV
jgi:hypothetical protein